MEVNKKIALCFLTYDNLSQPELWSKIINSNKDKLNIYIHNKNEFIDEQYQLHQYCINNKIPTKWGKISLVQASLLLFKEAFNNTDNYFFILLSDKCIPLYNFQYIYDKIIEGNNNIISCYKISFHKMHVFRYNTFADKSFISSEDFVKQNQWCILNRDTIQFFLENNFINKFGHKFDVPDEHYFINIIKKFNIDFINKKITHNDWSGNGLSPKTYNTLSNNQVINIQKNQDYLFMRKISNKCKLPSYYDTII